MTETVAGLDVLFINDVFFKLSFPFERTNSRFSTISTHMNILLRHVS